MRQKKRRKSKLSYKRKKSNESYYLSPLLSSYNNQLPIHDDVWFAQSTGGISFRDILFLLADAVRDQRSVANERDSWNPWSIFPSCVYFIYIYKKERKKGNVRETDAALDYHSRYDRQKIGGRQKVGASSWFLAVGQGSIAIPHSGLPGVETRWRRREKKKKKKKKRREKKGTTLLLSRYRSLETVCTVKKCLLGVFRLDGVSW